jgi:hypothetical protein
MKLSPADRARTAALLNMFLDFGLVPLSKDSEDAATMTALVSDMAAGLTLTTRCPCGCGSWWQGEVADDGTVVLTRNDLIGKKVLEPEWWKG